MKSSHGMHMWNNKLSQMPVAVRTEDGRNCMHKLWSINHYKSHARACTEVTQVVAAGALFL